MEKNELLNVIEFQKLLAKRVSFVDRAERKHVTSTVSLSDVLHSIKSGNLQSVIVRLRQYISNGEYDKYDINKKYLPAVTFCGVFKERRKKEYLTEYNNLIVLDIDKLTSEDLKTVHEQLSNDIYVFALWYSPSGNGVKGLVALNYNKNITEDIDRYHKIAFQQLEKYLFEQYEIKLDSSGKDTTRLCFYSSDMSLIVNEGSFEFNVNIDEDEPIIKDKRKLVDKEKINLTTKSVKNISKRDALYNSQNKNNPYDRYLIQNIIKYLEKRNLSITKSYDDWFRVATAIANTFTFDIGLKYFLRLSKIDTLKYDQNICTNMLISIYENKLPEKINFETIIYFAINQGFEIN